MKRAFRIGVLIAAFAIVATGLQMGPLSLPASADDYPVVWSSTGYLRLQLDLTGNSDDGFREMHGANFNIQMPAHNTQVGHFAFYADQRALLNDRFPATGEMTLTTGSTGGLRGINTVYYEPVIFVNGEWACANWWSQTQNKWFQPTCFTF